MISLSRSDYSVPEEYLMLSFAWVTHVFMLPIIIFTYKTKQYWITFVSVLTFISSLMYRTLDTLNGYHMFLEEQSWHRLCNIGTIASLLMVIVHLMDNQNQDLDVQLNYAAFTVALIIQEPDPWHLGYTFGPLMFGMVLAALIIYTRRRFPKYENNKLFTKGIVLVMIGCFFFLAGLNMFKDYLRIYNGMWRIVTSWGCFYLMQTKRRVENELSFFDVFSDKIHFE